MSKLEVGKTYSVLAADCCVEVKFTATLEDIRCAYNHVDARDECFGEDCYGRRYFWDNGVVSDGVGSSGEWEEVDV